MFLCDEIIFTNFFFFNPSLITYTCTLCKLSSSQDLVVGLVSLEKSSCWHFFFGKKFLWTFFLWKKIPVDIFSLEKNSCGHFFFGKKFLWTFFLWKKIPVVIFPLGKNSCWHFFFGKKFLLKSFYLDKSTCRHFCFRKIFLMISYNWKFFNSEAWIMKAVLINKIWEKIPKFKYCLEKCSQFQI